MEISFILAVILTGFVVVFIALILLVFAIYGLGNLFQAFDRKKAKKDALTTTNEKSTQPVVNVPQPQAISIPDTSDDTIIAVISAAVAAMGDADNTTYAVKSIKASGKNIFSGRNAWASAGVRENTSPF